MPVFKVTPLFRQGEQGWSETFYQTAPDIDNAQFKTNIANLVRARLGIMSKRVTFQGVRVSDPLVFRDSRFFSATSDLLSGIVPFYNIQSTEQDTALVFRFEATSRFRRLFLARGCPEFIVNDTDNTYKAVGAPVPASWGTKVTAFELALLGQNFGTFNAGNWQLYVQDPEHNPLVGGGSIIVANDARSFTFVTTTPIQFVPGNPLPPVNIIQQGYGLVITQAKGTHGINGRWRLFSVNPVPPAAGPYTYTVFPENHLVASPIPTATLKVRALTPIGKDIDNVEDESLAYRKTGRPFGQLRGRRRAGL